MSDDGLIRIDLANNQTMPKQKMRFDGVYVTPLYNPDGTPQRERLMITDYLPGSNELDYSTATFHEVHDSGPGWVLVKEQGNNG